MVPGSLQYYLYLFLYTAFWSAVSVILYRTFFLHSAIPLSGGLYFFLAGLILLVCGAVRSYNTQARDRQNIRDPISGSLALSGLLSILYANLA